MIPFKFIKHRFPILMSWVVIAWFMALFFILGCLVLLYAAPQIFAILHLNELVGMISIIILALCAFIGMIKQQSANKRKKKIKEEIKRDEN